jgi:hypothetical protein
VRCLAATFAMLGGCMLAGEEPTEPPPDPPTAVESSYTLCDGSQIPNDASGREQALADVRARMKAPGIDDRTFERLKVRHVEQLILKDKTEDLCELVYDMWHYHLPPEMGDELECIHTRHCAVSVVVHCPEGFTADSLIGCDPTATCDDLDVDGMTRLCTAGNAACCRNAGWIVEYEQRLANTHELPASRAQRLALAQTGCKLGVAALCAAVAELEPPGDGWLRRACTLGHTDTCRALRRQSKAAQR